MKNIKLLSVFLFTGLILCSCKSSDGTEMSHEAADSETSDIDNSDSESDDDSLDNKLSKSYTTYEVFNFLDEDISEISVKKAQLESYDSGDVYSLMIDNEKSDELDRSDLGLFLITEDKIYMIPGNTDDVPSEDDFLSDGIEVYSEKPASVEIDGQIVKISNDGYLCKCSIYSETGESGFYSNYVWDEDKELVYYKSGYGAENEPIEFGTKENLSDFFSEYSAEDLNKEDFCFDYQNYSFALGTDYNEYIDNLGYPENFEDNNCGFISNDEGYRWQLQYPDAGNYENSDLRIVCVSPENEYEGSDTYIDFINLISVPTSRDVSCGDSIYSIAEKYGRPDEIQPSSYAEYTDLIYEYDGNKLIFTILPDNTISKINIDLSKLGKNPSSK